MKTKPSLTIAIPTYNRPKYLSETLRRLLPQINDDWILHIHDNCSDLPVAEAQADLLASFGAERLILFRNVVNVGACSNILRCIEYCETEWVIILSDDEEITPDYIQTVLETIAENPDIVFATFSTSFFARDTDFATQGLSEFCQKMDDWGSIICISCCLYRKDAMIPYVRIGYHYNYTLIPHTAMLLKTLKENNGKCLFSAKRLIEDHGVEAPSWNRLNQNVMFFIIDLIPDRADQKAIMKTLAPGFTSPNKLAANLTERAHLTHEDPMLPFEIRCACYTMINRRAKTILWISILRFLMEHPRFFLPLVRFGRRIRGYAVENKVAKDLLQDL